MQQEQNVIHVSAGFIQKIGRILIAKDPIIDEFLNTAIHA